MEYLARVLSALASRAAASFPEPDMVGGEALSLCKLQVLGEGRLRSACQRCNEREQVPPPKHSPAAPSLRVVARGARRRRVGTCLRRRSRVHFQPREYAVLREFGDGEREDRPDGTQVAGGAGGGDGDAAGRASVAAAGASVGCAQTVARGGGGTYLAAVAGAGLADGGSPAHSVAISAAAAATDPHSVARATSGGAGV
eukprot:ctg_324.g212